MINYLLFYTWLNQKKNSSIDHSVDNPYMFGFPEKSKERHIDRLLNENMIIVLVQQRDGKQDSKKKLEILLKYFTLVLILIILQMIILLCLFL